VVAALEITFFFVPLPLKEKYVTHLLPQKTDEE